MEEPSKVGDILEQLCAGHWTIFLDFVWARLSHLEMSLSGIEHRWPMDTTELINALKSAIFASNRWRRRLSWINDELDTSLQNLGFYSFAPNSGHSDHLDLRSMTYRTSMMREKFEQFSDLTTGILGIVQGELSFREAKLSTELSEASCKLTEQSNELARHSNELAENSLRLADVANSLDRISLHEARLSSRLTLLGLFFVPLAYGASLFSMAGDFQPGAPRFWIYFVVSVPLMALTFIVFLLIRNTRLDEYFSGIIEGRGPGR